MQPRPRDRMLANLRILLVLETCGGGSGRHVLDLAREYALRGHGVHIVYSAFRIERWFDHELEALDTVTRVCIDMRRSPHPCDVLALMRLRRYIREAGPFDVIHGHSSKGGALARIAALGHNAASVYTPHAFRTLDTSLHPIFYQLYRTAECALARFCRAVINVSEEERLHACTLGLPRDKLFVVGNGLASKQAPARTDARAQLGLHPENFCIGFVGRLVAQKAPDRLIDAFALVHARFPAARLLLLGDGPMKQSLHSQVEREGLGPAVYWRSEGSGFKAMPAFDVFVMPSLYEAFAYVLIEAATAGLPLIATPVGGAQALIQHGENGFVVPHGDVSALAQALITLIEQPERRQHMGVSSRQRAEHFTVSNMATATLDVYAQVLDKSRPRHAG